MSDIIEVGGSAVGIRNNVNKLSREVENPGAMRAAFDKLNVFSGSEDGCFTIACYGDSVSPEVGMMLADMIAREKIGFMARSSFGRQELNNALQTPTGVESAGRWPGSGTPSYVLAGGATYVSYADGPTPDPVYMPKSDQHWVIPNGGSVTWSLGSVGSGHRTVKAYMVKEPSAGNYSIELLNDVGDVLIGSAVTGSLSNATIDAMVANFTELDTKIGYKIRVTCTSGTIRALGVVAMPRRCVLLLALGWGGTYLAQINRSSKAIFDFICNDLNVAMTLVETRGETPSEGAGGGIGGNFNDGINDMCTRLLAIPGSKVLIGGKPTTTQINDDGQATLYRAAAQANDFVFVDGVKILKNNATLAALLWNKRNGSVDNVHLPLITSAFIAGFLYDLFPWAHVQNLWNCRKVVTAEVSSGSFKVPKIGHLIDQTLAVEFAKPGIANTYDTAQLLNVSTLTLKKPDSGSTAVLSMYDNNTVGIDKGLSLNATVGLAMGNTTVLKGRKTGWTQATGTATRTAFDTTTVTTEQLAQRVKALIDDLHAASSGNVRLLDS